MDAKQELITAAICWGGLALWLIVDRRARAVVIDVIAAPFRKKPANDSDRK
ncbi:MAG TPA: hypothetical protein VE988_28565 [Gemmataceae bacterium]|nr:hypothetical protein [Gemmataceae bacterium]